MRALFSLLVANLVSRESVLSSNPCLSGPADASTTLPKRLFLTFNGGPTNGTTGVLAALKVRGLKATFYLSGSRFDQFLHGTGQMLKESVESLHELARQGHQIGSHSFSDFPDTDYSDTVACSYHKSALWNRWDFVYGTQAVAAELSCAAGSRCNSTFSLEDGLDSQQLATANYQLTTFLRLPCYSYFRTLNETIPPADPNTTDPAIALADWLPRNFKIGGGFLADNLSTPEAVIHGWHQSWTYDANVSFRLLPTGKDKDDVHAYAIDNTSALKSVCLMADQIDRAYLANKATGGRVVWLSPDSFFQEEAQQLMLDQLLQVLDDRGYTFELMEAYEPLPWSPPIVNDDDDDDDDSDDSLLRTEKLAYLFTMACAICIFTLLLLWYGVILPALEARGCHIPSCSIMFLVRGCRNCCGCGPHRTQISKWSDATRYKEEPQKVAPRPHEGAGGSGFSVVNRVDRGLSFFTEWVSDMLSSESDFAAANNTFVGQQDGENGIELSGGFVSKVDALNGGSGKSASVSAGEVGVAQQEKQVKEGGSLGGSIVVEGGSIGAGSTFTENINQLQNAAEQLHLAIVREEECGSRDDERVAASYFRNAGELFTKASESRAGVASALQAALRTKADHCKQCAAELVGTNSRGRLAKHVPFVHTVYDVSYSFDLLAYETLQQIYANSANPAIYQQEKSQAKLYSQLKQQLVQKFERKLTRPEKDRMSCIMEIFIALVHESHDSADIAKLVRGTDKVSADLVGNPLARTCSASWQQPDHLNHKQGQPAGGARWEEDDITLVTEADSEAGGVAFEGNNPGAEIEADLDGTGTAAAVGSGGRGKGLRVESHVSANPAITFDDVEMTTARYTAVTTRDPGDFTADGNVLKVTELKREVKVMICITIFNEPAQQLNNTLLKVGRNIKHLMNHKIDSPGAFPPASARFPPDQFTPYCVLSPNQFTPYCVLASNQFTPHCVLSPNQLTPYYVISSNQFNFSTPNGVVAPDFRALGGGVWRKVVTTIVADGRQQMDSTSLSWLDEMGLVDEKLMMVSLMGDKRPELHLFEGSVQVSRPQKDKQPEQLVRQVSVPSESPRPGGAKRQSMIGRGRASIVKAVSGLKTNVSRRRAIFMPMQLQIAIKEHNAGKLDSHSWAMKGLGRQMNPKYIILLDAGTNPSPSSIYQLLKAMELQPHVGGCCGEIAVEHPFEHLTNPAVAAQNFEYKVSSVMDRPMESVFGFITVLPGAFSAYRFEAIEGAPLEAYFKTLSRDASSLTPFEGNMYLAEDRILVFELLAKQGSKWTMTFVKEAVARTDVPENLVDLIKQRRWDILSFLCYVLQALLTAHSFAGAGAGSTGRYSRSHMPSSTSAAFSCTGAPSEQSGRISHLRADMNNLV
jgi:hypothetical protein